MDTNALAAIFQELAQSQKTIVTLLAGQKSIVGPLGPNSVLITTMILAGLGPVLASVAVWIKSRSIERAVNGDRMLKDVRLVELEKSKAVMEERERLRDVADALKEAVDIKVIAKAEGKKEAEKEVISAANKLTH